VGRRSYLSCNHRLMRRRLLVCGSRWYGKEAWWVGAVI
jgi:hypothetical protein